MDLSLWANHLKLDPLSFRDRPIPETDLSEGRRTPSGNDQISGSWQLSARHTKTDIRNQSPVILGLVVISTNQTLLVISFVDVSSCVPLAHTPQPEI
jgi:hypothetical protein